MSPPLKLIRVGWHYKARVDEAYFLEKNGKQIMETASLSKTDKHTILVIEDNPDEWFLIRWALLWQFPQMTSVWVSDATGVIPYLDRCLQAKEDLPKLIFIDLYLPSRLGLSVLEAIKSHPIYHRIPTIILSRSNDPNDIVEAFNHSANSYIVKPLKYKEWLEAFSGLQTYWRESSGSTSLDS